MSTSIPTTLAGLDSAGRRLRLAKEDCFESTARLTDLDFFDWGMGDLIFAARRAPVHFRQNLHGKDEEGRRVH